MRATGAEPTNEIASMPGWSSMPSTTSRPPLTRLTTPAGRSSSSSSSKAICWVRCTCSDGLSTKLFPHAIANGRNQNGTIAGKLNGTIAAHTPTGWRMVSGSTVAGAGPGQAARIGGGGGVLEHAALHRGRQRAGGLDHLDHARHLGAGVGQRLAHLGRDRAGQIV